MKKQNLKTFEEINIGETYQLVTNGKIFLKVAWDMSFCYNDNYLDNMKSFNERNFIRQVLNVNLIVEESN